jgi:DsbC/DsbD-like thiol-disulfide interchange protein
MQSQTLISLGNRQPRAVGRARTIKLRKPRTRLERQKGRRIGEGLWFNAIMPGLKSNSDFSRVLPFALCLSLCAAGTKAAGTPIPHGTVELIAENQWITTGHTLNVGLRFQMEKGWHIYWINPGDSGEPPKVMWQLPAGITTGPIEWPTPRRLGTTSVVDYGYEDSVMLIVPIHADQHLAARGSTQLTADLRVLVCREMCIPGKARLSLTLPVKSQPPAPDPSATELFTAVRKSLPRPLPANWKLSLAEDKDFFVLAASLGHQSTQAIFFPVAESQIDNAAPQKLLPTAVGFRLTLRKSDQLVKPIERLEGVLVLSADQSYSIDVPLSKPGASKDETSLKSTAHK